MAQYKAAIKWIVDNDDTQWVADEKPIQSVTAALVADLFGKTDEQVFSDIKKGLARLN